FSHRQVQDTEPKEQGNPDLRLERPLRRIDSLKLPPGQYLDFGPWNEKWDRVIHILTPTQRKPRAIDQHMSVLTPHFALIAGRLYGWDAHYLLKELNPADIRKLLSTYPALKNDGGKGDADKRFTIVRFLVEAGFYDAALAELDSMQRDMPDLKERIEAKREDLRKLLLAQLLDLVEQAQKVGRHGWAQAALARFPTKGLEENLLVRIRALQSSYETINKNVAQAQHFLERLPQAIADSSMRDAFSEAAAVIVAELNADTVNRLESFVKLAQQDARERE